MSQQLTMLQARNQCFKAGDDFYRLFDDRKDPVVLIKFTRFKGLIKVINGSIVFLCLTLGQVRAQSPEVFRSDFGHVSLSVPAVITEGIKNQKQFIGDGIEFFPLVSVLGKPVSEPGTNTKSTNRPDERNEGRVGVEQKNKFTPDDSHKFWRLLFIQLSVFLVAFPAGVYLSMRANLRRDWRKHIPKGGRLKVPALGMISALCIPRCLKSSSPGVGKSGNSVSGLEICGRVMALRGLIATPGTGKRL